MNEAAPQTRASGRDRGRPKDLTIPTMAQHDPVAGLIEREMPRRFHEHVAVYRGRQTGCEQGFDAALELAPGPLAMSHAYDVTLRNPRERTSS